MATLRGYPHNHYVTPHDRVYYQADADGFIEDVDDRHVDQLLTLGCHRQAPLVADPGIVEPVVATAAPAAAGTKVSTPVPAFTAFEASVPASPTP